MAFAQNFIFLFLHFLLLLINPADSNCPPSFECGKLGALEFPLTNRPECGLFMMDNCSSDPVVQFGSGGTWYKVLENISKNRFLILDSNRQTTLTTDVCMGLGLGNVSLPLTPSSTFTVSPTLTLFYCYSLPEEIILNYNCTVCPTYDVFYENRASNQAPSIDTTSFNCSMYQVPGKPNQNSSAHLSDLLAYEYEIEWNVSDACYACHREGGQCLTSNAMSQFHCERAGGADKKWVIVVASMVFLGGVIVIAGLLFSFFFLYCKKRRNADYLHSRSLCFDPCSLFGIGMARTRQEQNIELFLKKHRKLAQRRYTFSDLKKMTKSFSENLGEGGYGSVYKGMLPDGRLVAVKVLKESKGNGEEFINEVASISQTSHVNVVTLLGFSFEGSKRALIYDFMPNGSLEKYIQTNVSSSPDEGGLGWEKLFEIALCVARGLEYLHEGCVTRILHFDIKPQNILLDKDFNPKISDFGLAKLCPSRSTIVSMLVTRGTAGYIAPEVFCSNFGGVSYKSDVYSYGMMVLEIAGEKKKVDRRDVDRTSEIYFPYSVYKQLESMDDRLDHEINMNEDASELAKRKLIIVGLWCIQTDPKDRPSMSKVVEMLEGQIESLQIPPKPYLSSPPRLAVDFSITDFSITS